MLFLLGADFGKARNSVIFDQMFTKLKICFLSSAHPPFDKRVYDKEAISLSLAGFKVQHLCAAERIGIEVHDGVEIITYRKPSGVIGRLCQLFSLYRTAIRQQADMYHCNEVDSWFVGVLLRVFAGKKCVFDVHEHYPSTFAEQRFPKVFQPTVAALIRIIFMILTPFTERIVLAKRSVAADFHCSTDKKILVQNFTPLKNISFREQKRKPKSLGEKMTIVHFGLFSKMRGWPQVLEAMTLCQHQNLDLIVIGEINDGTRKEFDDRVKDLRLGERVKVHNWMPFEQAFLQLLQADIGIIAFQPRILNHVYAMPHKMFDYMAAGLAVLCPHFAIEVAPIVKQTRCGLLIDTSDPQDIANKLDSMLMDPAEVVAMGERGKSAVREHYNWEAEAEALIAMYKKFESDLCNM